MPVRISRAAIEAVRPHADSFGLAAAAGARSLAARSAEGTLWFRGPEVEELHQRLRAELAQALTEGDVARIVDCAGKPIDRFLDQVVLGWLRAEPGPFEFLAVDRRALGAYVYEVLRAELDDIGLDLVLEPRPEGYRVISQRSRWRLFAPVLGTVALGAFVGFYVELLGRRGGLGIGFGVGMALGLLLGLKLLLGAGPVACSECGRPTVAAAITCGHCGTRFIGDTLDPWAEAGRAPGPSAPEDDPGSGP